MSAFTFSPSTPSGKPLPDSSPIAALASSVSLTYDNANIRHYHNSASQAAFQISKPPEEQASIQRVRGFDSIAIRSHCIIKSCLLNRSMGQDTAGLSGWGIYEPGLLGQNVLNRY